MSVQAVQLSTSGIVPNTTGLGLNLSQQLPTQIYIETNDAVATVISSTYLNKSRTDFQFPYSNQQMALVWTTDNGGQTQWLNVTVASNGSGGYNYGLASPPADGVVATPTVANQITYSTNTGGALASLGLATALFNAGNISAGLSGTAGALFSFPSAATSGKLGLVGVANSGNFTVDISNVSYGQGSTLSFADVGSAAGRFLVANTATPFTSGNIAKASGTGGLMVDASIAASNLMVLNAVNTMAAASQIILDKGTGTESSNAVTINKMSGVITSTSLSTASLGTEVITLTNSEIAATSVFLATVQGGTNTTPGVIVSAVISSHTAVITLTNSSLSALNGTVVIGFAVF